MTTKVDDSAPNDPTRQTSDEGENASNLETQDETTRNVDATDTKQEETDDAWYAPQVTKEHGEESNPSESEKPDNVSTKNATSNGGTVARGRKRGKKSAVENEGNHVADKPVAKRPYKRKIKTEATGKNENNDVDGHSDIPPQPVAKRGRKKITKSAPSEDMISNDVKREESSSEMVEPAAPAENKKQSVSKKQTANEEPKQDVAPVEKKKRGRKPKTRDEAEELKKDEKEPDSSVGSGTRWSGEHKVRLADYVLAKLPSINWNEIAPELGGRNPSTVMKQWIGLKKKFLELAQKME